MKKAIFVYCAIALLFSTPQMSLACETTQLVFNGNLDARSSTIATLPSWDLTYDQQLSASQAHLTVNIYDALSQPHAISVLFYNLDGVNSWIARAFLMEGSDIGQPAGQPAGLDEIALRFDSNGDSEDAIPPNMSVYWQWTNGARAGWMEFSYPVTQHETSTSLTTTQDGTTSGCAQYGNLDFDGDGRDDLAIWRPHFGLWAILKSSVDNADLIWKQWGLPGDYPMPGDYTGDSIADLVVWRPTDGYWYVCKSDVDFDCTQPQIQQFGLPGDRPLKGDFDGDRILDFAVWRPPTGMFYYKSSRNSQILSRQWGLPGDIPFWSGTPN